MRFATNFARWISIVAIAACSGAIAQGYPVKPVRMLVPFPPGGGTDFMARLLGRHLSEKWGQSVVIENRPGASMMIASEIVAKAAPDGYTIIMSSSNHTINPSLYPKIPYDTVKDFAAVTQVATSPFLLVVHPSLPVKTTHELIALARARKGQLAYASSGTGGPQQLAGELFKTMAKVDITHVPYKGTGPAEVDLVGGHVQVMFATIISAAPQVAAGKMRALAVTSLEPSKAFPDLPTVSAAALKGYEASSWWGILTPARTPSEVIDKLHADVVGVLQVPEPRSRITTLGGEPVGNTPKQFSELLRAEIAKWARVIKDANIKID
ncbi:MAG: tripartite tricarboxylate transporter substrate binding protein [Burkholderiales bacterium]|nr:tripartite tricarboxylate transporter substrate binding protein [Burkholderiales bacterium]